MSRREEEEKKESLERLGEQTWEEWSSRVEVRAGASWRAWKIEREGKAAGERVFGEKRRESSCPRETREASGVDLDSGERVRLSLALDLDTGRWSFSAFGLESGILVSCQSVEWEQVA